MSGQRQVEIRWSRHSLAYVLVGHGAPADAKASFDRAGQGVDEMHRLAELNDFDVVRVVTRPDAEIAAQLRIELRRAVRTAQMHGPAGMMVLADVMEEMAPS